MLIAEAGNAHFGNLNLAKELIVAAKDSGCDAVKFQAYKPGDFKGSMPERFYELCALTENQYMELVGVGEYLKIPVFFSIFNPSLLFLDNFTDFKKLSAWQTNEMKMDDWEALDDPSLIVSVNGKCKNFPPLKEATVLYATDYNTNDPILERIGIMQRFYKRPVGLSDHTIGIETCIEAINLYEVPVIEKHFCIEKNMAYKGKVFRDTVHGIEPKEMEVLARYFKEKKTSYKNNQDPIFEVQ